MVSSFEEEGEPEEDLTKPLPLKSYSEGSSAIESLKKIEIGEAKRYTFIDTKINVEKEAEITQFLREHRDIFVWSINEILEIDPGKACHHLNIYVDAKPVKQYRRIIPEERAQAVYEEVQRLQEARFIWELDFPYG